MYYVHSKSGECIATCVYAEDAAVLVSHHGDGATVRAKDEGRLWREGREGYRASDPKSNAPEIIRAREKCPVHSDYLP